MKSPSEARRAAGAIALWLVSTGTGVLASGPTAYGEASAPAGVVRIQVVGPAKRAMQGCRVEPVPPEEGAAVAGGRTDDAGFVELALSSGAWVQASCPGGDLALGRVSAEPTLVLAARPATSLSGHLLFSSSFEPASEITCCVEPLPVPTEARAGREGETPDDRKPLWCTESDRNGAFSLGPLASGRYMLRLSGALVREELRGPLELRPGKPFAVTTEVTRLRALEGRVTARDEPVAGAELRLRRLAEPTPKSPPEARASPPDAEAPLQTLSDAEGRFRFDPFPLSEDWVLEVTAAGYGPAVYPGSALDPAQPLSVRLEAAGKICGEVFDEEGEPVPGASIELTPESEALAALLARISVGESRSGEDGAFCIEGLPAASFTASVQAEGFLPWRNARVSAPSGAAESLGTLVLSRGQSLEGRVQDARGNGVGDAELRAVPMSGGDLRHARTRSDRNGRFLFTTLWPTTYRIEASKEGYCGAPSDPIAPTEDRTVTLTLRPCGGVSFAVRTEDGRTVPPLTVFLVAEEEADTYGHGHRFVRHFDAAEESLEIEGVPPGTYLLRVVGEGYGPATRGGIEVEAGSLARVPEIVLRRGTGLAGLVQDRDGDPLAGAWITCAPAQGEDALSGLRATWSESDGSFRFEGLGNGNWVVRGEYPGLAPAVVPIAISENSSAEPVVLELGLGGAVEGHVLARDDRPVASARVELRRPFFQAHTFTDLSGYYRFDRIPPGHYQVGLERENPTEIRSKPAEVVEGEVRVVDFRTGSALLLELRRSGEPAAGAQVALSRLQIEEGQIEGLHWAITDPLGRAKLHDLEPGNYTLSVWTDTEQFVRPLGVPESEEATLSVPLPPIEVPGQVESFSDGRPIPGARVRWSAGEGASATFYVPGAGDTGVAVSASDAPQVVTWTDGAGRFRLHVPESGPFALKVSAAGYLEAAAPFEPYGAPVRVQLHRAVRVEGRVVDASGRPVEHAIVAMVPPGQELTAYRAVQSGPGGSFQFGDVPEGRALFAAWAPGLALHVSAIDLSAEGTTEPLALVLSPGGGLELWIREEAPEPFDPMALSLVNDSGFDVVLWSLLVGDEETFFARTETVGADLHLVLPHIPPGNYRVRWRGTVEAPVSVQEGDTTTLELP